MDYPEILHESHRHLPFLPVRKDKLLTTLEDKKKLYGAYIIFRTCIKAWLIIKKGTYCYII